MIVVDTNVVAYLLIPGEHTAFARATLARDAEWVAPTLWRSEFRNVLALYMREGELTLAQAAALQDAAEELLAGREQTVASNEVLELAQTSRRSAYDCEFVAVARRLRLPLVTSDRSLRASFAHDTVSLQQFGAEATGS
ncbi:MAG: VapC toxin family domain ribonuclease [Gemmatimonadetes bacterium]|nr:VapC toxin family domain ribonuclease [Gemmatimonadota bacterium]